MMLASLDEFVTEALPDERRLELDDEDVCPEDSIRAMCGEDLGVQLVFIPEETRLPAFRFCYRSAAAGGIARRRR